MTSDDELLRDTADDLLENAPCGYLATRPDGTIVRVNRTFESWTGLARRELIERVRFSDLLSPGGRIYHETHYAPLLEMQGWVREIAVEIVRADGSRLPALVNSVLHRDEAGKPVSIGTIVFYATDRRRYEEELLRARRRERDIARSLQRSLLSGELPSAPGLRLDFAYRPAVLGLDVGGDWYDGFWLEEGETVGLVVGDVVGRGIEAAATMGQLRSAVRALASTRLSPGRLLAALDRYVRRHGVGDMSTLIYAELALCSGDLRFACAGHPPPLVVDPAGEPQFAWAGRSVPLGVQPAEAPRNEASCRLCPGGGLLLYTDGLVERRRRSLDEGMERLRAEVRVRRDGPATSLADAVVRALDDPERADDVCVLVASLRRRPPAGAAGRACFAARSAPPSPPERA